MMTWCIQSDMKCAAICYAAAQLMSLGSSMIPHLSSAIMVSKHATIKDPQVRELSEQIIKSQEKETAEMEAMLDRLDN